MDSRIAKAYEKCSECVDLICLVRFLGSVDVPQPKLTWLGLAFPTADFWEFLYLIIVLVTQGQDLGIECSENVAKCELEHAELSMDLVMDVA